MVGKNLYIENSLELGKPPFLSGWDWGCRDSRTGWHLLFDLLRDAWILGQLIGSPSQNAGHCFLGNAGRWQMDTVGVWSTFRHPGIEHWEDGHPGPRAGGSNDPISFDALPRCVLSDQHGAHVVLRSRRGSAKSLNPDLMVLLTVTPERTREIGGLEKYAQHLPAVELGWLGCLANPQWIAAVFLPSVVASPARWRVNTIGHQWVHWLRNIFPR